MKKFVTGMSNASLISIESIDINSIPKNELNQLQDRSCLRHKVLA